MCQLYYINYFIFCKLNAKHFNWSGNTIYSSKLCKEMNKEIKEILIYATIF